MLMISTHMMVKHNTINPCVEMLLAKIDPNDAPINKIKVYSEIAAPLFFSATVDTIAIRAGAEIAIPATKQVLAAIVIDISELTPSTKIPNIAREKPTINTLSLPYFLINLPVKGPNSIPGTPANLTKNISAELKSNF